MEHLSPVWSHVTRIQPVRGEGVYLYDNEGTRYTDFTSGIGVTNTGHCHPRVVQAIRDQAQRLLFSQMNVLVSPVLVELSSALNEITSDSLEQFFFSNSGAEAVEASVKLARQSTNRRNIIVFQGSFHGRTHMAMAMTTSKYAYRYNYQPLPGGVFVSPFPYSYYYGWDDQLTTEFCLKQLDLLLQTQSSPEETAAIVIEPVLGEGGYVPAPIEFLRELRTKCDRHGILLVIDEIQSGFGRTGSWFCYEHADIEPDIVVMAKGLGSGLPISAIGASAALMSRWKTGTHGGTYGGGSTIAAASAHATIEVIRDENLAENAASMGEFLQTGLHRLKDQYPILGDVRGRGLMVASEFSLPTGEPYAGGAKAIQQACLKHNLLLLTCGPYGNVIRWIPPLIVNREQIEEGLAIFETALSEIQEPA